MSIAEITRCFEKAGEMSRNDDGLIRMWTKATVAFYTSYPGLSLGRFGVITKSENRLLSWITFKYGTIKYEGNVVLMPYVF